MTGYCSVHGITYFRVEGCPKCIEASIFDALRQSRPRARHRAEEEPGSITVAELTNKFLDWRGAK
jgi:hypothetical protein